MAMRGFLLGVHLRESLVQFRDVEERIVSEAVASDRHLQNLTFGFATKCGGNFSIARESDDADEARRAFASGKKRKLVDQFVVVVRVARLWSVRRDCEPGGEDAGSAAESVDLEAGIVR